MLRWGLDAPAQADADFALRIVIALRYGITSRNRWDLGGWTETLLPRARSSTLAGRSIAIAGAADWLMLIDDLEAAEQVAREALDIAAPAGDTVSIAWGYHILGSVRFRQGQTADALNVLAEGHEALRAAGAQLESHASLHGLESLFYLTLGDVEAARREADTQLEIARASANPGMLAAALASVGWARFSDEPAAALAAFEESMALNRAGAGGVSQTLTLGGAAQLRARAGDRSEALELLRAAIANDHDNGNRVNLGLTVERADRNVRNPR